MARAFWPFGTGVPWPGPLLMPARLISHVWRKSRMVSALNTSALSHPKEILAEVLNHTEAFTAGAEQYDDLTMLCLQ